MQNQNGIISKGNSWIQSVAILPHGPDLVASKPVHGCPGKLSIAIGPGPGHSEWRNPPEKRRLCLQLAFVNEVFAL